MNYNAPDFYEAPNRLRQPAGTHELLPMIAPANEFEAYVDLSFGFLVSGTDPRHVPSNVIQSRRFYPALLRQRAVVRGGLSLGLVLGLLFIGAICFFCMIGPQGRWWTHLLSSKATFPTAARFIYCGMCRET